MWLIVGLGNPGKKYELTRHNFGFLAVDALLKHLKIPATKTAFHGQVARDDINGEPCILLKPETLMNRSGESVQEALSFHKIPIDNLIVIHDELDFSLGELRIKHGGGNGGHNGLKDITRCIGPEFIRIRLGVGRPNVKGMEADFVLSTFHDFEWPLVNDILEKAISAVTTLVTHGVVAAQSHCQISVQK